MSQALQEFGTAFDRLVPVELGHVLTTGMPSWPTHAVFSHELLESYTLGQESCHYKISMDEHSGTHIDAPSHFIADGPAHYGIDQVPLEQLFGRAAAIEAGNVEPGTALGRDAIESWEADHGAIEPGDAVLVHFGWDQRWGSEEFLLDWPGLGADAAEYLVGKQVRMVGTDALSMDTYESTDFPAHYTLLGNRVLIAENLDRVGELPAFSYLICLPLRIGDGSGSPVRPIALVPPT